MVCDGNLRGSLGASDNRLDLGRDYSGTEIVVELREIVSPSGEARFEILLEALDTVLIGEVGFLSLFVDELVGGDSDYNFLADLEALLQEPFVAAVKMVERSPGGYFLVP